MFLVKSRNGRRRHQKLLEPFKLWKGQKRVQHQPAKILIRAREAEADEMMRARHELVVKVGIQEAFKPGSAVGAAIGSEGGVDEAAPIVVHHGKVAQDFTGRESQGGAKLVGTKFQP